MGLFGRDVGDRSPNQAIFASTYTGTGPGVRSKVSREMLTKAGRTRFFKWIPC